MGEKKKIGIITLYNNNNNYGGIAQAYALSTYFKNLGYDSELINYKKGKNNHNLLIKDKKNILYYLKKVINKIRRILRKPIVDIYQKKYEDKLLERTNKLEKFRDEIQHSKEYDFNSINQIENEYDFFVTGSDQCWNPGVIDDAFVYSFLKGKNKKIFSYASSVAVSNVSEKYKEYMKRELKKYSAISVREEKSKNILQECTEKNIEWVVDPTLLLDKSEWKNIAGKRMVEDKYIFSYMLGEGKKQRKLVNKFARTKNLKLVTIPYIVDGNKFIFKMEDKNFGDVQLLDISFNDFLSLIANAEYVLTDSFHAVCFSYIFEKEFYVFERNSGASTSSRIYSLLKLLDINTSRVWFNKIVEDRDRIDYKKSNEKISKSIENSKKYIQNALDI